MFQENSMENNNDIRSTTTKAGLVAWIDFPDWGPHPGLIIDEYDNGDLRVISGTSQPWHEGDEDGFFKVESGCGLRKPTWFQTIRTYRVPTSRVMNIAGEVTDGQFREISEKVEGL